MGSIDTLLETDFSGILGGYLEDMQVLDSDPGHDEYGYRRKISIPDYDADRPTTYLFKTYLEPVISEFAAKIRRSNPSGVVKTSPYQIEENRPDRFSKVTTSGKIPVRVVAHYNIISQSVEVILMVYVTEEVNGD